MRLLLGVLALVAFGAPGCSSGALNNATDGPVAGHPDGGGDDGPAVSPYAAWWYPECQTADGTCPLDTCLPNAIVVAADRCAPYQNLEVGCVSRMTVVSTWYCYTRESSGELIFTQFAPKGAGFVRCPGVEGGGLPTEGALCLDGAAH
jgi:hypothetical protein